MKKALKILGGVLLLGTLIFLGRLAYGYQKYKKAYAREYAREYAKIDAEFKEKEKKQAEWRRQMNNITEDDIINRKLRHGMSMRNVERSVGCPEEKQSSLTANGKGRVETWVYSWGCVSFVAVTEGGDLSLQVFPEKVMSQTPNPPLPPF